MSEPIDRGVLVDRSDEYAISPVDPGESGSEAPPPAAPTEPTTKPLGKLLTLYRATERRTVRELAALIGVSPATLSRVERGHMPDLASWRKLEAWLLGLTV